MNIGDRYYSERYKREFVVGQTKLSTHTVLWAKSVDGRYDLGISAVKEMTKL